MEEALKSVNAWAPKLMDLGTNLLIALVILVVGWWVSALLGRWVRRMATRSSKIDPTIVPMFYSTVVWTVRIFTLIAVLARFGVQTASLIAVLGAAGLAVGLALQGTLQNIAAGIMLLILRPVRTGEFVGLSTGAEGTVEEVGLFLTRLVQVDGIHITLPRGLERHHHQLQPQQDPPPGYPGAGALWRRPGTGAGQAQGNRGGQRVRAQGSRAAGEGQRVS